jgi:hypothetical protein
LWDIIFKNGEKVGTHAVFYEPFEKSEQLTNGDWFWNGSNLQKSTIQNHRAVVAERSSELFSSLDRSQ